MTDKTPDKQTESINALKNANKHLSDLFTAMNRKNAVLGQCSSDLLYVAKHCGELQVKVFVGNELKNVYLKSYLETIAANLEGARS